MVKLTSACGDTSGVKVPFSIYNDGSRTRGTWDASTKTFTPNTPASPASEETQQSGTP